MQFLPILTGGTTAAMTEDDSIQRHRTHNACELLDYAHSLYQLRQGCDIFLVVEGSVQFDLHKLVLGTFSQHFRKVIEEGCVEGSKYFIPSEFTDKKKIIFVIKI